MDWSKEDIIVTGGYGMIGSHLVDELISLGAWNLAIIDDLSRGRIENLIHHQGYEGIYLGPFLRWEYDLSDPKAARDIRSLMGWRAKNNVVFHLAAKVTGIHYNTSHNLDMMQSNLDINSTMVNHLIAHKPKLLVWVSTACVYPHDAPVPTPEDCADVCNPEPTNFGYGVAKWVGEQQARYLCLEHGIPTIIVRFFNAFGPRDYYDKATSHVAPALIRRVMEGENPLNVWGSGDQTRALVDARDIAKALCMLVKRADTEIDLNKYIGTGNLGDIKFPWVVNIGHEQEISIGDLACRIAVTASREHDITLPNIMFDTSRPDGYPRRAADTTKLRSLIGWVPDTPLDTTLVDMFKDYIYQRDQGWIDD